jgi:hypothetical protein
MIFRRRNLSARASSNKRPSRQTLLVHFLVKLRTELDVAIGGFVRHLEFSCSLILIRPPVDGGSGPSWGNRVEDPMHSSGWFRVGPVLL